MIAQANVHATSLATGSNATDQPPTIAATETAEALVSVDKHRGTIKGWVKGRLLNKVTDFVPRRCTIERASSPIVREIQFVTKAKFDELSESESSRRSESQKARWRAREKITEHDADGKEYVIVMFSAAAHHLNVSEPILNEMCDENGEGAVYLEDKPFTTTYRDFKGSPVPAPSNPKDATRGEGTLRYLFYSELETYRIARNDHPRTVSSDEAYSPQQTSELTGISHRTLKYPKETAALNLESVEVLVRVNCQRKDGKPGKAKWSSLSYKKAFSRKSVDEFVKNLPQATPLNGFTIPDIFRYLRDAFPQSTICIFTLDTYCEEGILVAERKDHKTCTGPRNGWIITPTSFDQLKRIFRKANGNTRAVTAELRELKKKHLKKNNEPPSTAAAAPGTGSGQPAEAVSQRDGKAGQPAAESPKPTPKTPSKRGPTKRDDVAEVECYCYIWRIVRKHLLVSVRAGARSVFGEERSPKTDGATLTMAQRFAKFLQDEPDRAKEFLRKREEIENTKTL